MRKSSQVDRNDFVEPLFRAISLIPAVLNGRTEDGGLIVVAGVDERRDRVKGQRCAVQIRLYAAVEEVPRQAHAHCAGAIDGRVRCRHNVPVPPHLPMLS